MTNNNKCICGHLKKEHSPFFLYNVLRCDYSLCPCREYEDDISNRKKQGGNKRGKNNNMFHKTHSDEVKEKISQKIKALWVDNK